MRPKHINLFAWSKAKQQEKNLVKWIEALISGEYLQGSRYLYDPKTGCYCANGVALRVFGFPEFWGRFYYGYEANDWRNLWSRTIAPYRWFERTFGSAVRPHTVSHWNDNRGLTFAEIASRLVTLLPNGPEKLDLTQQIAKKIAADDAVRRYMRRDKGQELSPGTVTD